MLNDHKHHTTVCAQGPGGPDQCFISLPAPNPEYSLEITDQQPYSEFNARIEAEGYEPFFVSAMQILPGINSLQQVPLRPLARNQLPDRTVIPPHTLFYEYPPKIPEPETNPSKMTVLLF